MADPVAACEAEIVARLIAEMPYLRSCEDVGQIQTALELEAIISPAIRIMTGGDSAAPPMNVSRSRQLMTLRWNVFAIASSFGPTIEGRHDQPSPSGTGIETGINTMLYDVRRTLRGFVLASQAPFVSKLFYLGAEPWSIGDSSVVYVSRWYNTVIEEGV